MEPRNLRLHGPSGVYSPSFFVGSTYEFPLLAIRVPARRTQLEEITDIYLCTPPSSSVNITFFYPNFPTRPFDVGKAHLFRKVKASLWRCFIGSIVGVTCLDRRGRAACKVSLLKAQTGCLVENTQYCRTAIPSTPLTSRETRVSYLIELEVWYMEAGIVALYHVHVLDIQHKGVPNIGKMPDFTELNICVDKDENSPLHSPSSRCHVATGSNFPPQVVLIHLLRAFSTQEVESDVRYVIFVRYTATLHGRSMLRTPTKPIRMSLTSIQVRTRRIGHSPSPEVEKHSQAGRRNLHVLNFSPRSPSIILKIRSCFL
ncbi:hypothetical protein CVT26_008838 [Gymnopilus dilepis]|uniref:Uncharacterized protein n=1 Tax=Gymnopilus dilepis TaxID=231916 RepID=A0A409YGD9_9AGAR|nr:hypothetical protein CVT26_008838 [Gymnopilus dilepis]